MEKYNLPNEQGRNKYEIFEGKNTEQMPLLLSGKDSDGKVIDVPRNPISYAGKMQRILQVKNASEEIKSAWNENYHDTSDLNPQIKDEVKIFLTTYANGSMTKLGKKYLRMINPQEELINGAINLNKNNRYEEIKGDGVIVTKISKLAKKIGEPLSKQEVKDSLFYRVILRDPNEVPKEFAISGLHDAAIDYIFAEGKQKLNSNTMMDILINPVDKKIGAICRAWCVLRTGDRSRANGRAYLGDDGGRFVGLASGETLGGQIQGENSQVKTYTQEDLQKLDESIQGLEGFLKPKLLEGIKNFRNKI